MGLMTGPRGVARKNPREVAIRCARAVEPSRMAVHDRAKSKTTATATRALAWLALAGVFFAGCKTTKHEHESVTPPRASAVARSTLPQAASSAPAKDGPSDASAPDQDAGDAAAASAPDASRYAWLGDERAKQPPAVDTLLSRFATPPGYERVALEPGSFGDWLRTLPLAARDTPVVNFRGDVVHPADDEYLAAVVAIDIGTIDLEQSPDAVLRLHAEWSWSVNRARDLTYRGAKHLEMPFSRWLKGDRLIASDTGAAWVPRAKPSEPEHAELRAFLDGVFTWANSTSVATHATPVSAEDVAPGDFFIHVRSPGHALIVLDIAHKKSGERLALLGQALNPAQSIHVLRPGRKTAWFSLRPPKPILTPYTQEFPWSGLRRLPGPSEGKQP